MEDIIIKSIHNGDILHEIGNHFHGELDQNDGEYVLKFSNSIGNGAITSIDFENGISQMSMQVRFSQDTSFHFNLNGDQAIKFIFLTEGQIIYNSNDKEGKRVLKTYQNTIIRNKRFSKDSFTFLEGEAVIVNFIIVIPEDFSKKKNHNISAMIKELQPIFNPNGHNDFYSHNGSTSLKIADLVNEKNSIDHQGSTRLLTTEGYTSLILAMQIRECQKYLENLYRSSAISDKDVIRTHKISAYITAHVSEDVSVRVLSRTFGLTAKKLQLCFKILYGKTVNEFTREVKLEIARESLKTTDLSISEVVYSVGFKSLSYFSKIFYEYYNILPKDFKKSA